MSNKLKILESINRVSMTVVKEDEIVFGPPHSTGSPDQNTYAEISAVEGGPWTGKVEVRWQREDFKSLFATQVLPVIVPEKGASTKHVLESIRKHIPYNSMFELEDVDFVDAVIDDHATRFTLEVVDGSYSFKPGGSIEVVVFRGTVDISGSLTITNLPGFDYVVLLDDIGLQLTHTNLPGFNYAQLS